jgi:hypothetical protein
MRTRATASFATLNLSMKSGTSGFHGTGYYEQFSK